MFKTIIAMPVAPLTQSRIVLTRILREDEEAAKLVNRIEDAKTERLLIDAAQ